MVEPFFHKETHNAIRVEDEIGPFSVDIPEHTCNTSVSEGARGYSDIREEPDELGSLRENVYVLVRDILGHRCLGPLSFRSVVRSYIQSR